MLLDVTCKTGKLQVDEGIIRVRQQLTGRIIWQCPTGSVTRITSKDGMLACDLTLHTETAHYQAEMVSKANASKLYALFPHLEVGATQQPVQSQPSVSSVYKTDHGRHWYQDQKLRTYIATYEKEKDMQHDMAQSGQYGWLPQSTVGTGGQLNRSLLIGLKNSKQKFTITYVRTPDWLAQH